MSTKTVFLGALMFMGLLVSSLAGAQAPAAEVATSEGNLDAWLTAGASLLALVVLAHRLRRNTR